MSCINAALTSASKLRVGATTSLRVLMGPVLAAAPLLVVSTIRVENLMVVQNHSAIASSRLFT